MANALMLRWRDQIRGLVIDLASGGNASYRRVLGLTENSAATVVGLDYNAAHAPDVVADLRRPLPFRDGAADWVILASFLYIAPDPCVVLREVRRILRHDGTLLLSAPFTFPYTPEPNDFQRFTEEGLRRHLSHAGFSSIEVAPYGGRWTSAVYLLSPFLRPRRVVQPVIFWLAMRLDRLTESRYPALAPAFLGYVVKATGLA
jgi:SAM-dependent methyltransferase